DGRGIALVDTGTGAGLALHLDRYRYEFRGSDGSLAAFGDPDASVLISTELRGRIEPPSLPHPPPIAERIGVDIEPLDIADPAVRSWLGACIPQEIGAVTRFHEAFALARQNPIRSVRGDAVDVLPEVLSAVPDELLVCIID